VLSSLPLGCGDWALLGVAVAGTAIEAVLRSDRAWLPIPVAVSLVVVLGLLWRRTHPLAAGRRSRSASGFGLIGMRECTSLLGGTCSPDRVPTAGAR
jgi:hypothetical protein